MEEKTPPGSLLDHMIMPVGEWPVTVAVHVVCWPAITVEGAQMAVMELVAFETERVKLPGDAAAVLFASPAYEAWMFAVPAPLVVTVTVHELVL